MLYRVSDGYISPHLHHSNAPQSTQAAPHAVYLYTSNKATIEKQSKTIKKQYNIYACAYTRYNKEAKVFLIFFEKALDKVMTG